MYIEVIHSIGRIAQDSRTIAKRRHDETRPQKEGKGELESANLLQRIGRIWVCFYSFSIMFICLYQRR